MKLYQVDAFTDRLFSGNPAGVCLLEAEGDEKWMQQIAAEMNLAETAFLHKIENGFGLRWFTPKNEVDLCGHATLASAHILWETHLLDDREEARFRTKSGWLRANKQQDKIELDFPLEEADAAEMPDDLVKGLGVELIYVGRNRMDYIVEVADEETVRNLCPNLELLKRIDTRGVIVTSKSSTDAYDFVSRFFAPRVGINEDPVTGSAHCCLAPYWTKKLNKQVMKAYQASERGGFLELRVDGNRVFLSGRAITFFSADMQGIE